MYCANEITDGPGGQLQRNVQRDNNFISTYGLKDINYMKYTIGQDEPNKYNKCVSGGTFPLPKHAQDFERRKPQNETLY